MPEDTSANGEPWAAAEPAIQAESYLRFRDLLEAAPDAILEVDRDGAIVLLNAAAERMFGYPREELLGQLIEILVPEALRRRHDEHRERYLAHPSTRPMGIGLELLARRKDGSACPVEISLSPIRALDGPRIIAIVRDISARKEADARINAMNRQFAAELAAANQQLEIRSREAEEANRLKSEFLASMSHELRTPLHTIIGFADLLAEELKGELNPAQKRFANHIRRDSRHLLELINDILDLSKIEAGRLDLQMEAFQAGEAISETLAGIRPMAESKRIEISENLDPLEVVADRVRFKEIFYNLVSNAVKFTPEGGRITVECHRSGYNAYCAVTDTGIGIPAAALEAIFDKFYQHGSTTRGVREGTGLGLAITKRLVEMHGGTIRVASKPGKGSRFEFNLPLGGPISVSKRPAEAAAIPARILFVSPASEHRDRAAAFLRESRFQVTYAESFGEVEERLRNSCVCGAVVDLAAFGHEGWQVVGALRKYRPEPSFPIIAVEIPAGGDPTAWGADVVFAKPVDLSILVRAIGAHVETLPGQVSRVLVVDDEEKARELLAETLSEAGLLPVIASSAREALEALERGPISAAVIDLVMPEMTGFELISRIRDNPAWSRLPVVVLTGKDMDRVELQGLAARTDAVFLKGSDWKNGFLAKMTQLLKSTVKI
jgi:PAS domain S-box-containing protein